MHASTFRSLALASCAVLAFAGCGEKAKDKGSQGGGHHHHDAPHGGEVLELARDGKEVGHLEMMHDHVGGKLEVYVFGSSFDKPLHVPMPVVTILLDGAEVKMPLDAVAPKPDGTAHHWKGQHDGLKTEPWNGRIEVVIDGKNLRSPLEGPAHSHK
jgi:hypothetical protein